MVWLVVLFCVLLVGVLARVFFKNARAIRQDVDQRFRRVQAQLEEEANAVVKDILNEHKRT